MYKLFIIIFLVCLVIIYLSNDCSVKESFTVASAPTVAITYTPAEKDKILQVLKDNYEMEALFNIALVAKGLQSTTGYTVPGDLTTSGKLTTTGKLTTSGDTEILGNLKVKGSIQVGDNINIKSDTNGDVITIGSGTTATNGKTKINIGKYSLIPTLTGTNDYIELKYNNNNSVTYGKLIVDQINLNSVNRPNGNNVIITDNNGETKLCDGSTDCNKYIYVRDGADDNQAGFYKKTGTNTAFNVHNNNNGKVTLHNYGGTGEIKYDNKARIIIRNDKTDICAGDNCNDKKLFINYDSGNSVAGIKGPTNRTDFQIINKDDAYRIITEGGTFYLKNKNDTTSISANPSGGAAGDPNKVLGFHNGYRGHHAYVNTNGNVGRWDEQQNKNY